MVRFLRWFVPAVLSAAGGIALAVWSHGGAEGPVRGAGGILGGDAVEVRQPAQRPPADPGPEATPDPLAGFPPPAGSDASPGSSQGRDTPGALQRLQAALNRQLDKNPAAALSALLTLDERQRRYLAEDLVRQAAEREPDATLQWIDEHFVKGAERLDLLLAAYTGMAATDPAYALNQVQSLPDADVRQHGVLRVLEAWARHDPTTAYEWVRSRTDEGAADLHVAVMEGYMKALPRQAGEIIAGLPAGETRGRLMDRYAFELAESDATAAAEWLTQFEGEVSAQQALASVYDQWARQDPWAAMDHAVLTVDGELGSELVGNVVVEMGLNRPGELAGSLDRIPQPYRALAAHRLAFAWAANDPEQAKRWVATLPPGELLDHARRGLQRSRGG